jgi:enterobacterial common antigen flippase
MSSTPSDTNHSPAALDVLEEPAPARPTEERTYGQILKSSALVGSSSAMNVVIGIARAKAMAILLGPAGMGLAGVYGSIADMAATIAGMGVNGSAVRQIAAAVASGDSEQIARTTIVLRRISVLLGLIGAALLIAFSGRLSALSFGTSKYAGAICLLAIAVFFRLVSAGQAGLIQGMRRVSDLAKMAVWGALSGAIISVAIVYFLREEGIVPSLVCGAAVSVFISWRYSRKIRIRSASITTAQAGHEAVGLLTLGLAFVGSVLMTMGAAYIVRIMVLRKFGLEATGLYQSAWTLGGVYVGFVLQAMGTDFYPRLTANANDNVVCNRMVNEQAQVGLLLASPGVLGTLTFTPLIITLFYNSKFAAAVPILRWICLGAILQVITWPMGFIILAKARQTAFLLIDLAWAVVYIGLTWMCVKSFGLNGTGIAFFGSYIFHALLTYPIVSRLSGFRWSTENIKIGLVALSLIAVVFSGSYVLPPTSAACLGIVALVLSTIFSIRSLLSVVSLDRIPRSARRMIIAFRLVPSSSVTT